MGFSRQTDLSHPPRPSTPFYRDTRAISFLTQLVFALVICLFALYFINNARNSLAANGRTFGWTFLRQSAGFDIAEGPTFLPTESYWRAFQIGIVNTLRVATIGIVLATLLGLLIALARLSSNWLLSTLAGIYIEIIRNTPLLVQLFFWYFSVILTLPDIKNFAGIAGLAVISNRGIQLAWPYITSTGDVLQFWLLGAVFLAFLTSWWRQRQFLAQGKIGYGLWEALLVFLVVSAIGFAITSVTSTMPEAITYDLRRGDRGTLYVDNNGNNDYDKGIDTAMRYIPVTLLAEGDTKLATSQTDGDGSFVFLEIGDTKGTSISWEKPAPVVISRPQLQGFNIRGGLPLRPEYAGLLLGLVVYTASFIAEIIRAGVNAVSKGQWEASRALGLSTSDTLRMIVLPQALRVAIPPLTSQFLNLTKNSSLALAVGYPDLFSIAQTIVNQSGAELQVILMLMATYLSFSLATSGFANWYNQRAALKER